jgi:hypothetical protein
VEHTVATGLSPAKNAIVAASLVLELLLPVLWVLFGALLPTIPAVAGALLCCFGLSGLLPLIALITLFTVPTIGRAISIAALSWAGLLAALVVVEEIVRAAITDYPDPVRLTLAIVVAGISILVACTVEITWLTLAYVQAGKRASWW